MMSAAPAYAKPNRTDLRRRVEAHLAALRCQLQIARSGIPGTYDVVNCRDGRPVLINIDLGDFARLNGL